MFAGGHPVLSSLPEDTLVRQQTTITLDVRQTIVPSFNYLLQSSLKLTALLAGAIALVIALQGVVVLRQLVGAAIAGRRSTTATNRYLPC